MDINSDFDQRVVVHSDALEWTPSPMAGVDRRPLDRVGDEVARATSVVRYAPQSKFSPHVHTGGEEFFVLSGTFQDEHGDFPAGSYIRNPPQSRHTPGSEQGCVLLVKLWQFDLEDRVHVRLNVNRMEAVASQDRDGVSVIPLYKDAYERVSILELAANTRFALDSPGGAELFVLQGEVREGEDMLCPNSWLRIPIDGHVNALTGAEPAKIWMKDGHLPCVESHVAHMKAVAG